MAAATSPEGALAATVDAMTRSTAFPRDGPVLADRQAGEQMLISANPAGALQVGLRRAINKG